MPFFSVVIPLYNKETFIYDTVKSVLNQSFQDFEIIIVNDGSTDNSLNIVEQIKTDKLRLYTNKNRGLSFSRNFGIKKANANFIAFLDADDLWMKDFLKTVYKLIRNNKHSVFATSTKNLRPKCNPKSISKKFNPNSLKYISNYFDLTKNLINFSAVVIHKKVFDNSIYFNENINYGEDEDFLIRCFTDYELLYYNEPMAYYRQGVSNQLTAPNSNFKKKIPDFDSYLTDENEFSLKPYLDFIHFKLVVLYKMERNKKMVAFYKNKIDVLNLSFIQKIKYHLPTKAFYYIKSAYMWFLNTFIHS